ncbi:hypothetical protein D3C78_18730 [compost metagenome]
MIDKSDISLIYLKGDKKIGGILMSLTGVALLVGIIAAIIIILYNLSKSIVRGAVALVVAIGVFILFAWVLKELVGYDLLEEARTWFG